MKKHLLLLVLNVNCHFDVITSRHFIRWRARTIAFCSLSFCHSRFLSYCCSVAFFSAWRVLVYLVIPHKECGRNYSFLPIQVLWTHLRVIRQLHLFPFRFYPSLVMSLTHGWNMWFYGLQNIQPFSRKFVSEIKYPLFSIHQVISLFFSLKHFSHTIREQKIGLFNEGHLSPTHQWQMICSGVKMSIQKLAFPSTRVFDQG